MSKRADTKAVQEDDAEPEVLDGDRQCFAWRWSS
jgi:hypothetical protein